MKLPNESIEEFREIHKAETGEWLSFKEAKERATRLLDFGLFVFTASKRIDEERRFREDADTC